MNPEKIATLKIAILSRRNSHMNDQKKLLRNCCNDVAITLCRGHPMGLLLYWGVLWGCLSDCMESCERTRKTQEAVSRLVILLVFGIDKFCKNRPKFLPFMQFLQESYKFVREKQICKFVTTSNISYKLLMTFFQSLKNQFSLTNEDDVSKIL